MQKGHNGVFLKWAELSVNLVNSGSLINHWSIDWTQVKDSISHMHLVSYTGDGSFEHFYCNDTFSENSLSWH